ncbi:MAG: peptidoglycan-binding protein [Clostridia bacterium]|nr:peptidoglycan-binding protein [Clostridia bacterium]
MKYISTLLVIALIAGALGGCQFAIVEGESIKVSGLSAMAEGYDLFGGGEPDISYLDDEPLDLTPRPSPTIDEDGDLVMPPAPTPTPYKNPTPMPTRMPKMTLTPEPDPTPTPYAPTPIGLHSRDDAGENKVRKLQQRLIDLGYLDAEADGIFGSQTLDALLRFQKDSGLEETGVLDDDTREALNPKPEVTTAPEDVLYARGALGHDIRVIHRRLRQYGFSARPESSQYDEDTAEEVMEFQSYAVMYYGTQFDDPADDIEVVDMSVETGNDDGAGIPFMPVLEPEATLRPYHALDGVVSENLYNYLADDRFPVYRETVQTGDEGIEVERVQRRLATLEYYYSDVTGVFETFTAEALKAFQHRGGLQETGIADAETQTLLYSTNAPAAEKVDQPYYIKVSLDEQRVYVYRYLDGHYTQLIKSMICSSGLGNSTPKGTFVSPGHRDSRWHYFVEFKCWAQYAFVITGNILFHSVIYSSNSESALRTSTLANLGHKASHGCVRLRVEDAKWIYEHCGEGQVIEVY